MASSVSSYFYYYTSPPSFSSSSSRPFSLSSNPNNLSSSPSHFRHLSFQPKKGIRVPNSPPCLRVLCLREPKVLMEMLQNRSATSTSRASDRRRTLTCKIFNFC